MREKDWERMLFCKKCQIEYESEEDKRFCPHCGSFLIKKEEAPLDSEEERQVAEEKPKEKFICPDCKIIYEKTKTCIRCGSEVISFASFRERGTVQEDQESETKEESSQVLTTRQWLDASPQYLICPICRKVFHHGKSCPKCGAGLLPKGSSQEEQNGEKVRTHEIQKQELQQPSLFKPEEDLSQEEISDPRLSKRSVDEQIKDGRFLRKVKRDYPRMVLNWSGIAIICIAAGYLLWSSYHYLTTSKSDSGAIAPPKEISSPSASFSSAPASSSTSHTEAEEIEKLRNLLEKIRKANLGKDINLFLLCYAKDFRDREGKKRATLESWENFNFLDLTFELIAPSLSGNTARAKVEWWARFSPKGGGHPQESKTTLEVLFKKEDGDWKIGEIKSGL